jgi:hypothetical protein
MPSTDGQFKTLYLIDHSFLNEIQDEQAWLIGLLASDGNIRNDRVFSLTQSGDHGHELIAIVQRMLGHNGPIYSRPTTGKVSHEITITSLPIVKRLADFGVVPNKTLIFTFPELIPPEHHAAFIRGYIEGDGSTGVYRTVRSAYPRISFVGTPEFINRCAEIIPVVGLVRVITRAAHLAEMQWNGHKALQLSKWLWANPHLPITRKQLIVETFFQENQPKYLVVQAQREQARQLLAQGHKPKYVAQQVGVDWRTIYYWREEFAQGDR